MAGKRGGGAPSNIPSQCIPSSVNVQGCPSLVPGHCRDIKEGWGQAPSQPSTPVPRDQGALKLHRKGGRQLAQGLAALVAPKGTL